MDFRFKYRRHKPGPHEQAEAARQEREVLHQGRSLAMGLAIPMSLAAGPVSGWLIGDWLDQLFGTSWIMLTMIILGTVAGFKLAIDMLLKLSKS